MKKLPFVLTIILLFCFSCYHETIIPVEASFEVSFKEGDESVPVYLELKNTSSGGERYHWEFEGGEPGSSTEKTPQSVLYTQQGTYKIKLTVTNQYEESATFEKEINIKDAIEIGFTTEILQNDFPPVEVKINNTTQGEGFSYQWTFENGTPSHFEGKNPPNVTFPNEGNHNIKLLVSNGFEEKSFSKIISVKAPIKPEFSWETAWEDYDYQAPVKIALKNETQNALSYHWEFEGGTPNTSTEKNPEITFTNSGTYKITLTSSNGKISQQLQKSITIHPNSNIYILENVKLGVSYAHNTQKISAFYSTLLRKSFFSNEITPEIAPLIDVVFQGNSPTFSSSRFVSPTQVQNYGFHPITGALPTIFINSQEVCNCGVNFSQNDFNAMQNDNPLKNIHITESAAGLEPFTSTFPRIVLFKTHNGRKGAIKMKQFVSDGQDNSYILCDIKVQK